jgi:hypothetical protein
MASRSGGEGNADRGSVGGLADMSDLELGNPGTRGSESHCGALKASQ